MTKHSLPAHTALTAIAACLALGSTSALAQTTDAVPDAPAAEIVVPSAQPAPAAPTAAPAITLPQVTAPVPAPAASAPVAEAAPPPLPEVTPQRSANADAAPAAPVRRAAPAETRTAQSQARTAPAPVAAPAPAAPAFTPAPVQSADTVQAPPPAPIVEQAPAEPAQTAAEPSGNEALWVVGGAAGALLLGVGSLVYLRRRQRRDTYADETILTSPAMAREPEPVFATPGFSVAPAMPVSAAAIPAAIATPADEPALEKQVAFETAAPASSAAGTQPLQRGPHADALENMIAQAPSAENPFLTRRKRLRRAEFLLEHGHAPTRLADAPVQQSAPEPVAQASRATVRKPAYSFSNGPVSFRPQGWKPATT